MGSSPSRVMRVVLDTNVVLSALLFEGQAARLVSAWQRRRFVWLVSKALLGEYIRTLHYPKFRLTHREIRSLIEQDILPFVSPVKVSKTPRVIAEDPADDHVLACAVAGKASCLVTGDRHLLSLGQHRTIPLISLADFLKQLEPLQD